MHIDCSLSLSYSPAPIITIQYGVVLERKFVGWEDCLSSWLILAVRGANFGSLLVSSTDAHRSGGIVSRLNGSSIFVQLFMFR